jgi:hypothetical protein
MKITYSWLLILLAINPIFSQGGGVNRGNNVTFKNNGFILNKSPFFPIGWYDDIKPLSDYTSHFGRIRSTGANLVLPYYQFLMDTNQSPSDYYNVLQKYLDAATKAHLMVVVQIPSKLYPSVLRPNNGVNELLGNNYIDYLIPRLKDHPALLGWYLVDEPENPPSRDRWTPDILKKRYSRIKGIDSNHPIFICYGLANLSDTHENVPTLNDWNPPSSTKNNYYDVLMEDRYLIDTNSTSPSPALGLFDICMKSFAKRYRDDGRSNTSGTTMVILQAYGLGFEEPHRDPTQVEIKYMILSYLAYAQDPTYSIKGSKAGGIFWWRQGITTPTLWTLITQFNNYFINNKIANVIAQPNINNLVLNDSSPIKTFLRFYNHSYYLFAINQSDVNQVSRTIKINIGNYIDCNEIIVKGPSIPKVINNFRPGNFILVDNFGPREAKVYKIRSK